jgi:23S rRNA-/tRNA-specific pseudouridylate synthase
LHSTGSGYEYKVDDGDVTVDGEEKSRSTRVQRGQVIAIDQPELEEVVQEVPKVLEPTILYEDEYFLF